MVQQKINSGRLLLVGLFFLLCAGLLFRCLITTDASNENKNKVGIKEAENLVQIFLTKEDTLILKEKFTKLNKHLDFLTANSDNAMNQYNRFFRLFKDGSVSQYQTYQAAKIAKETFEDYSNKVDLVDADKLPSPLKDTFGMAISNIEDYYRTKANAYEEVMIILNGDGDFKSVDKFDELDKLSLQYYYIGMNYLFIVESHFGMNDWHNKKPTLKRIRGFKE